MRTYNVFIPFTAIELDALSAANSLAIMNENETGASRGNLMQFLGSFASKATSGRINLLASAFYMRMRTFFTTRQAVHLQLPTFVVEQIKTKNKLLMLTRACLRIMKRRNTWGKWLLKGLRVVLFEGMRTRMNCV